MKIHRTEAKAGGVPNKPLPEAAAITEPPTASPDDIRKAAP